MLRSPVSALAVFVLASLAVAQQPVYHATRQPAADPTLAALPGGVMLSVPGVTKDFVLAAGGQFVQFGNGTARLTGRVFSEASVYVAFLVDIEFSGRTDPGAAGYASLPADLQLLPNAYAPVGPVDSNTFVHYTAATGTLVGVRNLDGSVLTLTGNGPIQVGAGANSRNGALGLLAAFTVGNAPGAAVPLPVLGTALCTVDLVAPWAEDTTHPMPDPIRTNLPAGRAMVLPGVASDYVFVPVAEFTEFADGHAELTGRLARVSQLDDAFEVTLTLGNRVDPGEVNHPPVGSPVLQMFPGAYAANGGSLDPAHWHYYRTATATLTGTGLNAGGLLTLANSTAVQVGAGANQTNTYFGGYGAFAATIVQQPTGRTLVVGGDVELFFLTAVFPVLPFPTLTPTPLSLPTLTDQGVVLTGDHLAWTELVSIDWDLIGGRSPSQWAGGWFRVLDNQHVEFHPRPGKPAGTYNVVIFNPIIFSNTIPMDLTTPTTPQLFAEAEVASFFTTHVRIHHGPISGPAQSLVVISPLLGPSIVPGLVSLDIGNDFSVLLLDDTIYDHDPVTGIAEVNYGPIDPALQGLQFYLQGIILDLGAQTVPLPVTNAWRVTFV